MKIAVDKNSIQAVTGDNNEYIYLFDNEPYQDLLNTKLHCIQLNYCKFVDINLTDYNVNCIKKAKITDKDYKNLQVQDYKIAIVIRLGYFFRITIYIRQFRAICKSTNSDACYTLRYDD